MHRWIRRSVCLALLFSLALSAAAAGPRLALGYLYGGAENLAHTRGALREVAPVCLELAADGSLQIAPSLTAETVRALHEAGVRVVPLLSNHWDRDLGAAALEHAPALAEALARAVSDYGLDGVQIDLENLTGDHRAGYVELVRLVREALPADKTVAVAVAANPRGITTGWHASYDEAALAQWADYLMLMAYDEHYRGSDPGPVASRGFVESSIRHALASVPPEKLVLGIPFFGRIWREDGDNLTGQGLGDRQVRQLLLRYGGSLRLDSASGSAEVHITVDGSAPTPTVAGIPLTPGDYVVWFEDESSKKELLSLVEQYRLKGAAGWRLGQEEDAVWDYFSLWLNGLPFSDLQGHWAMASVVEAAAQGWMRGVSGTSFAPDRVLTRAEAAVLLTRLLGLEPEDVSAPFRDTRGHWAEAEIAQAAALGLLTGVGGDRFAPDAPVTREQLAALLHRAAGRPAADAAALSAFADGGAVSPYAKTAMAWAVSQGLFEGDAARRVSPAAGATRAAAAALLCRYAAAVPAGEN